MKSVVYCGFFWEDRGILCGHYLCVTFIPFCIRLPFDETATCVVCFVCVDCGLIDVCNVMILICNLWLFTSNALRFEEGRTDKVATTPQITISIPDKTGILSSENCSLAQTRNGVARLYTHFLFPLDCLTSLHTPG